MDDYERIDSYINMYNEEHNRTLEDRFRYLEKLYRLLGYIQGVAMIKSCNEIDTIEASLKDIIKDLECK